MAGVVFYGLGIVMIPGTNRYIRFIDGEYSTIDPKEIELLAKRYTHDVDIEEIEEPESVDKPKRGRKPKCQQE